VGRLFGGELVGRRRVPLTMPGWYIHMEAAKKIVDALEAGAVGPEFRVPPSEQANGVSPQDWAKSIGGACHTWRNYLALGAIGPDLFYLLPDFHGATGEMLLTIVNWVQKTYAPIDEQFLAAWTKFAQPVLDDAQNLPNQLSGGLLKELANVYSSLGTALQDAVLDLASQLADWFGLFTSGPPQAFADSAFFWSDMFHYRRTFEFAQRLFENATSDRGRAFAVGWMSHCAVDVTGHGFVNAKAGGPYRDHWQRHHLIENHLDATAYDSQHGGFEPYGELDTSCLHMRLAFRVGAPEGTVLSGASAPFQAYVGRTDQPAYDYFTGFPAYQSDASGSSTAYRDALFDLDSGDLPNEVAELLIATMHEVWDEAHDRPGTSGPKVLLDADPAFRDGNSGVPSAEAIGETFRSLFSYVKFTSTGGYKPPPPTPPPIFGDQSPPIPPGFSGVVDDPSRGGDDHQLSIADIVLAILAWPVYLTELATWLATTLAADAAALATYPVRESLYELAVVPAYSAYLAARRPLVMSGFLVPKHDEIERGLVELGIGSDYSVTDLAAALDSPDGTATAPAGSEPSGRDPGAEYGRDTLFPRDVVTDLPANLPWIFNVHPPCGAASTPSEFLRPWEYPLLNQASAAVSGELNATHPGPWLVGQTGRSLLEPGPGSPAARAAYEGATTPAETEAASALHVPAAEHLGNPVDYGLYVIGQLASAGAGAPPALPDFNLDSDRGYGYHCWDWNRRTESRMPRQDSSPGPGGAVSMSYAYETWRPSFTGHVLGLDSIFDLLVPCTPPQGYCQQDSNGVAVNTYASESPLAIHYLSDQTVDPGCGPGSLAVGPGIAATAVELRTAGLAARQPAIGASSVPGIVSQGTSMPSMPEPQPSDASAALPPPEGGASTPGASELPR